MLSPYGSLSRISYYGLLFTHSYQDAKSRRDNREPD